MWSLEGSFYPHESQVILRTFKTECEFALRNMMVSNKLRPNTIKMQHTIIDEINK
jgi:hypothetical protein